MAKRLETLSWKNHALSVKVGEVIFKESWRVVDMGKQERARISNGNPEVL